MGGYPKKLPERPAQLDEASFRWGIRLAAEFAGTWDSQVVGNKVHFEDLVLMRFNLLPKGKERPKPKMKRAST